MSANNTGGDLSSPWKEFLGELDSMLRESLELHCIVLKRQKDGSWRAVMNWPE